MPESQSNPTTESPRKIKVYLAAPLFNAMEQSFNEVLTKALEEAGASVYLPQRDSGEAFILGRTMADKTEEEQEQARQVIFIKDIQGLIGADVVVAVLDGRVPDEGTVFEMGLAYGTHKPIYSFSSDQRSFMNGMQNLMLRYSPMKHAHSITQLLAALNLPIDEKFKEAKV